MTSHQYNQLIDELAQLYVEGEPEPYARSREIAWELEAAGIHEDIWQGDVFGVVEAIQEGEP
jgi:hypothetical protein